MDKETSPQRDQVAQQIRQVREYERMAEEKQPRDGYITDRRAYGYVTNLHGIKYFLEYVNSLGEDEVVVDIGTGGGRGWSELAESPLNPGLRFEATALRASATLRNVMEGKKVKVRLTSADVLRGYPDESISGIVGLFSLTYSADQSAMAENLFRKLKPGGAIKTVYSEAKQQIDSHDPKRFPGPVMHSAAEFVQTLLKLGCLVELNNLSQGRMVVVSVKPRDDGRPTTLPKNLLENDYEASAYSAQEHVLVEYFMKKKQGQLEMKDEEDSPEL